MSKQPRADLLIELGCEELPPKSVDALSEALFAGVADGLEKANISFDRGSSKRYSTPRRLALVLAAVESGQPDQVVERRGPSVDAAFDDDGNPTPAAQGFARSVGMDVSGLQRMETEKGAWLYCKQEVRGKALGDLIYEILETALRQLPIPRPMRWSDHEFTFVRPVHWLIVLHGETVLEGGLLGQQAGQETRGHRIHAPGTHRVSTPAEYEDVLMRANVIADPVARREKIEQQARAAESSVIIDGDLLNEVNNLVEWPVAVVCSFDEEFLEVPHAALIASMQDHQKFFPVANSDAHAADREDGGNAITNRFVSISNVDSNDFDQVRSGYERVIRPRLADARFFLKQDEKTRLADYAPLLDKVVFQKKIGTIGDKTRRIAELSKHIANASNIDSNACVRAASLCKCDLMTQMVGEFPELQGEMGAHYAAVSGEPEAVATAIAQHYAPRFAGDSVPSTPVGAVVSLADRADTLVGIFAAGLAPTGNKDPFALRRAALGLVRVLNEASWEKPGESAPFGFNLELPQLLGWAAESLSGTLEVGPEVLAEVQAFIEQRSRGYFADQGYSTELVNAALASGWAHIRDLRERIIALNEFMAGNQGKSLAAANKRIQNILRKSGESAFGMVNPEVLEIEEERALFEEVKRVSDEIEPYIAASLYKESLKTLSTLASPVDAFFDTVMVMDENEKLRRNRLALLAQLKAMFDEIADLSVLG